MSSFVIHHCAQWLTTEQVKRWIDLLEGSLRRRLASLITSIRSNSSGRMSLALHTQVSTVLCKGKLITILIR